MDEKPVVAVLVGSLRRAAWSLKVAHALIERAPALDCRIVPIGELPLYNEDLDGAPPQPWLRFRDQMKAAGAVLFVTPEYNRSIPGGLKNAIDVGSRPYGQSVFDGLPAAVVSVTPYQLGAFGANHALRQTFVFLNVLALQQPEAYVANAGELFDGNGKLKNQETGKFFTQFMEQFARWIAIARKSD